MFPAGSAADGRRTYRVLLFAPDSARAAETRRAAGVSTIGKAENVIFILWTGAPSHIDTFDFKNVNGVTPAGFQPARMGGIDWPSGIMPKIGQRLGDLAIVRSVQTWALVHQLAQVPSQIGRSAAAALGDIAPNIGSVVAIERGASGSDFPPFVALNANGGVGSGYLSTKFAPFRMTCEGTTTNSGVPNTTNTLGEARVNVMCQRLTQLDGGLRQTMDEYQDYNEFYSAAGV